MFGLGGTELLLVLLIAVIFIGPKELPKVASQLGRFYRQFKDAAENLKTTVEKEIQSDNETPPTQKS